MNSICFLLAAKTKEYSFSLGTGMAVFVTPCGDIFQDPRKLLWGE